MKPLVKIENVGQTFNTKQGKFVALRDIDLTIDSGEVVSLIGHSGCGKSTLLNLIAGLTLPTAGVLLCDGREIAGPGPERAVVFQNHSLLPWMTCFENVMLGVEQVFGRKERRSKLEARVEAALAMVHMDHAMHKYPHEVSGGMKQRVGIVRALATSPQVLLMDEPFGALDAQTRVVMQQILTNMWQRFRISVLFITHDIDESIFLSDRVYVMTARPGKIKAEIPIPLPRPRTPEMASTPEYLAIKTKLRNLISEESLKAMGGELKDSGLAGFDIEVGPQGVAELI